MPIYEYYCSDCKTAFERLKSMAQADDLTPCASCEGSLTTRLPSLFYAATGSDGDSAGTPFTGCGDGMCGCGSSPI